MRKAIISLILLITPAWTVLAADAPALKDNAPERYVVQKGDTLFLISKKHPGITIEDLKKWNSLCDEVIQPGMKLKING